MAPTNPYAASKAGAELLASSYATAFGLPLVITRANNAYGPGQFPEKFIPKTLVRLLSGRRAFLHGDGTHRRSYMYVTDMASAFAVILHRGVTGEVYNVGSTVEKSNGQVIADLLDVLGLVQPPTGGRPAATGCDGREKLRVDDHASRCGGGNVEDGSGGLSPGSPPPGVNEPVPPWLRDPATAAAFDAHVTHVRDRHYNDLTYAVEASKLCALGWAPAVRWADGLAATAAWYASADHLARWPGLEGGLVAHFVAPRGGEGGGRHRRRRSF